MRYLFLLLILSNNLVLAQQYISKNGSVHFFSEAPMENIEAENNTVAGIDVVWRVSCKDCDEFCIFVQSISMKTTWKGKGIPLRLLLIYDYFQDLIFHWLVVQVKVK